MDLVSSLCLLLAYDFLACLQTEKHLSDLVVCKAVSAKVDRPAGLVRFGKRQVGTSLRIRASIPNALSEDCWMCVLWSEMQPAALLASHGRGTSWPLLAPGPLPCLSAGLSQQACLSLVPYGQLETLD